MKYIHLYLILSITLVGCTINFSNVSSSGEASDVIDTEQTPTNDIKAEIPLHPVGL